MVAHPDSSAHDTRRVCIGAIVGAHGVRGLVRVRPFTDAPESVTAYGLVTTEPGTRTLRLTVVQRGPKGQVLARVAGVADRTGAEALKGERLYVARSDLPAPADDDEFYHVDLIGLSARGRDGRSLGTVRAIYDFGAGDVIEIADGEGAPLVVPFTREIVPEVDIAGGTLTVDPPEASLDAEASAQ